MTILKHELQKIWSLKLLFIVAIVSLLFYVMFMQFYVDYYKGSDHPKTEVIEYTEELLRRYGTVITQENFAEFIENEREIRLAEAEEYIKTMPIFKSVGIYSYADYKLMAEEAYEAGRDFTAEETKAHWTLLGKECDFVEFKLQTLEITLPDYYNHTPATLEHPHSFYHELNSKEQARILQSIENQEILSPLNYWTYSDANNYIKYFSILTVLATLILVSPLIVSDRASNIHYQQYSSKLGRKILKYQLGATVISAALLTLILSVIFALIFNVNGASIFWNCYLNSDFNIGMRFVFPLTYGQWVILSLILLCITSAAVSALAFILSRFNRNLVTLAMSLIPVFAACVYFCNGVFNDKFTFSNLFYRDFKIFGTEIYVCISVLIIALIAAIAVVKREKRVDVL